MIAAGPAAASTPTATAAKTCHLTSSQQFHSGATYLLRLSVRRVSCASGLKVEKAFQSCRRATRGHTTCRKPVSRYRCAQKILDSIKSQYDASVTCKRGSRKVAFTYTQNK